MDVDGDARAIGRRLRRIRKARDKSLEVIAGLSGLSTATLSRIENGLRALDSRSEIAALADALQVAPSELVGTRPELAPGSENKNKDDAVEVVHHALRRWNSVTLTAGGCALLVCCATGSPTSSRRGDAAGSPLSASGYRP